LPNTKQCEIFATAGSEEKLEFLRELGVDLPINYSTQDFETVIKKETGGKGVDAAFLMLLVAVPSGRE
jgi:NADPH2:quinone reductase